MKITNKNILLISPNSWGGYFVSKHHYALELAKENQVFFLNSANYDSTVSSMRIRPIDGQENLFVIDYNNSFRGLRYYPSFIQNKLYKSTAKKIIKALPKIDIVWSFELHRFPNLDVFEAPLTIFHPVDRYPTPFFSKLMRSSDIAFATDQSIFQAKEYNTPHYVINHGLSDVFLTSSKTVDIPNKASNRTKAALVGNPQQKYLSQKTLWETINKHPEVDFYFIGQIDENQIREKEKRFFYKKIRAAKNVFDLGKKDFKDLKDYLALMDILLICYDLENNDEAPPNPHKLLEYLSSGKAIVSNFFPFFKQHEDLLFMADSLKDYPTLFGDVLKNLREVNNEENQLKRKLFAQGFTYQKQLVKIEHLLDKHRLR